MGREKKARLLSLLSVLVVGWSLGLGGCAAGVKTETPWSPWSEDRGFRDLWFAPGASGWAALDKGGALWIDGKPLAEEKRPYQHLDGRVNAAGEWRLAAVDRASNEVRVLRVRQGQVVGDDMVPSPEYEVVGLCLYRDRDDNLSVFLLDERGGADQWLLAGNSEPRRMRRLVLPPDPQSCRVDDRQGALYVSEETLGVWRYAADAERDAERELVDTIEPRGTLRGGVAGLATVPDGLAVLDKGTARLHLYRDGKPAGPPLPVPGQQEPERLAASWRDNELTLVVLDDEGARARVVTLPWSAEAPPAVEPDMAVVRPVAQTEPVARFGDAADDPAIWVHPEHTELSRVLGTDKKSGLYVYDLNGRVLQFLPVGRLNNVDVRGHWAVASNRDRDSLQVFGIDPRQGQVREFGQIETTLKEIYGLCLHQRADGVLFAIANGKNGDVEQYRLALEGDQPRGSLARRFRVDSQPEGCVADDDSGLLFIGEEDRAVWALPADADAPADLTLVMETGDRLVADIEGLALYTGAEERYLVISSQGNDSYVVLDARPPFTYRGRFRIAMDARLGIDGVSETDGLEVTAVNLGGAYGEGMLVVQDGRNRLPQAPQNFKYVPWSAVREALGLPKGNTP